MTNGYFFDKSTWSFNTEGIGTEINVLWIFILAPFIGLLFLMFLPFIGFYLTGKALLSGVGDFFEVLVQPRSIVGEVHLTGYKPADTAEKNTDLDEIAKEINSRRK